MTIELYPKHVEWIKQMVDKYDLPDEHKALRIIVQYVIQEANEDDLFNEIRCSNC